MTLVAVDEKQEILLKFGNRVRELRKTKGLSQEAFASLCGLDRTYISGIERGVRNVSLANISLISQSLGVSLAELMRDL
jgi:transcriptional regulator with XRE-family HTH domain